MHRVMSMKTQKILCASHDTLGARAAETAALEMCGSTGSSFHHLVIVPDFWKNMMGDDWLNNAVTQARFGNYVENQLKQEITEHMTRLSGEARKRGIAHSTHVVQGKPTESLLMEVGCRGRFNLAVIGSPRPSGSPGYRCSMALKRLVRNLDIPLLIIPYPAL